MKNLDTFFKGRTIVVPEKGSIVEQGAHYELIKRKGEYYKLVKNQSEH